LSELDHQIDITTNLNERIISIYDSGIGMTRDQIVENLGTIARSGSSMFKSEVEDDL
jgi:molecular chaperone HtpG